MKNQIFHILACNLNPVQTEVSLFQKYLFNTGSHLRLTDFVVFQARKIKVMVRKYPPEISYYLLVQL